MALTIGPDTTIPDVEAEIMLLRIESQRMGPSRAKDKRETRIDALLEYLLLRLEADADA